MKRIITFEIETELTYEELHDIILFGHNDLLHEVVEADGWSEIIKIDNEIIYDLRNI